MSTSTSTRIAAGVTAAYLRDAARRPAGDHASRRDRADHGRLSRRRPVARRLPGQRPVSVE
jgi:hypothetical protein